jgi:hypothetical protein
MTAASKVGALYALTVFLIGFMFGTVRVLLIVPRLHRRHYPLQATPFWNQLTHERRPNKLRDPAKD